MSGIDVRERLRPFGILFEKSLDDLIKGIRANSNDQEKLSNFFEKSIQECKQELKASDTDLKSIAILKLSYLEMYGYDMSWCSFSILEVMASSKFQHKRIGYLAAIQILQRQNNEDALMLMTNLLKKDLNSNQYIETSLAISGIAAIISKELAFDICDDLVKMLTHSKPLIRKKTVLAMYKMFLKNPEALKMYYDRIVDRLTDEDPTVVSATVNVICELATMNPSNYIELAPQLYDMLTTTSNNWMVIRLLRLFSSLSVTEPRLKNKLLPQIQNLMKSTKSLSLIYECINTILNGNMLSADDSETAELITQNLVDFFVSNDRNLKYVGLLSFVKTCKIHQSMIQKHAMLILTSIYDNDITIRETSLEIINSLVTEHNIIPIVSRLTVQLLPPLEQQEILNKINKKMIVDDMNNKYEDGDCSVFLPGSVQNPITATEKYKSLLINKVIEICVMKNYANIPTFRWYLTVLNDLLKLNSNNKISNVDKLITDQMVDIGVRVPAIRPALVEMCLELCGFTGNNVDLMMFKSGLGNCMWLIGEYYDEYLQSESLSDLESDQEDSDGECDDSRKEKVGLAQIIDTLLKQEILENLGYTNFDTTLVAYIQSVAKIFSKICLTYGDENWSLSQFQFIKSLATEIVSWIMKFESSPNFEVQERALSFIEILKLLIDALEDEIQSMETTSDEYHSPPAFLSKGYNQLFSISIIKPVTITSQQNLLLPDDLDITGILSEQANIEFDALNARLELEALDVTDVIEEVGSPVYNEWSEFNPPKDDESNPAIDTTLVDKHTDDPYYIQTNETGANMQTPNNDLLKSKQKKPIKVKKYKKEKIIFLEDEDILSNSSSPISKANNAQQSKFYDASMLADIDLKQSGAAKHTTFVNEYEVTENLSKDNEEIQQTIDGIKIEAPLLASTHKKKPKKKVKRKVAVIE